MSRASLSTLAKSIYYINLAKAKSGAVVNIMYLSIAYSNKKDNSVLNGQGNVNGKKQRNKETKTKQ